MMCDERILASRRTLKFSTPKIHFRERYKYVCCHRIFAAVGEYASVMYCSDCIIQKNSSLKCFSVGLPHIQFKYNKRSLRIDLASRTVHS